MATSHDFYIENKFIMAFSGYILLKKPTLHFIINIIVIALQFSLYSFLVVMAVYTMYLTSGNKLELMRALNSFLLVIVTISFRIIRSFAERSVKEGLKLLKGGICAYESDDHEESYGEILNERVALVRTIISTGTKIFLAAAWSNTFIFPLMQWLTVKQGPGSIIINPYLPLHFCMPFNTRSAVGYAAALVINGSFILCMFLSVFAMEISYISFSLQLIAQIDILNFSLEAIERRALAKLKRIYPVKYETVIKKLYKTEEFQKCLYSCLRENIIHHHAILRLKKTIGVYLEAMNGFGIWFFSIIMASTLLLVLQESTTDMIVLMVLETISYFLPNAVGEIIIQKSSKTNFLVYSTQWPQYSGNFKNQMKIMAIYLKEPIVLKATTVNVVYRLQTFADVMITGYKIVNVIK